MSKIKVTGLDTVRNSVEKWMKVKKYGENPVASTNRGEMVISSSLTADEFNAMGLDFGFPDHHNSRCILIPITPEERFGISKVIFHDPHTTIDFTDGHKVTVTCMKGDKFDKTIGFYAAIAKEFFGDHNTYKKIIDRATVFDPKYLEVARTTSRKKRKEEKKKSRLSKFMVTHKAGK